ncbi:MAG TPA: 5-methyltetrahydropteroyltriglutamate--homocysteine S-methyltransferase [Bryobacteraceae bacterium]|nr:5-methyltetrahydropteroyltriglutamate--homocysteine S-methyltransferase [Bryobacteraceae bacterium]
MAIATNLGFSRIGANRELKKAVEAYWAGRTSPDDLRKSAAAIRAANWQIQTDAGIEHLPSGDFSFYDHVLDAAFAFDLIPRRFRNEAPANDLDLYFLMARGLAGGRQTQALEMTKWFDTNYHYLVPELEREQVFRLARNTSVEQSKEASRFRRAVRPVILGPLSLLLLSKSTDGSNPLNLLDRALPAYEELLQQLSATDATWVQIDEPVLVLDLNNEVIQQELPRCYERLAASAPGIRILLATYFGSLKENLDVALRLPISGLHLDLVRGRDQFEKALKGAPSSLTLSLGLIDGRNIWKSNLTAALALAEKAADAISTDRIMIAPSCSLLHVPVDLTGEDALPAEVRDWLAFGKQKLEEVSLITKALNLGRSAIADQLEENKGALARRTASKLVFESTVRARVAAIMASDLSRKSPHTVRKKKQAEVLHLPSLPTTTIGSFPQTEQLRRERLRARNGVIGQAAYKRFLKKEIEYAIRQQEEIGLDVLVHGEAERNDMVEYFGELLQGFAFTRNGWVQSYGSRCVKPPIIYGDVSRKAPMTIEWWQFTQSLTNRPVKGMLTGPVTILQWSFVRDDQPRRDTCLQLALAIRDEVIDLERAGCKIVQIDEPALREGLPLRAADATEYLSWAVDSFKLASAGVQDATQIHTHMCYANFQDIIGAISAMDADVISLESARSRMELLQTFVTSRYPNDLGPGVYDIHSPRVPEKAEIESSLQRALEVIPPEQLWVNPDCGLKTRKWEEVAPALTNMVAAARSARSALPTRVETT